MDQINYYKNFKNKLKKNKIVFWLIIKYVHKKKEKKKRKEKKEEEKEERIDVNKHM